MTLLFDLLLCLNQGPTFCISVDFIVNISALNVSSKL